MTIEKDIFLDTIVNPKMISLAKTVFVAMTKLNVGRMSKQITKLQGKLYAFERRVSKVEEDRKRLEEENKCLLLAHSSTK